MRKACVITPTYNEKENIVRLVPRLEESFKRVPGYEMHIVVADDTSPDGTGDAVRELQKSYDNVELLTDSKEGLGIAYQRAFRQTMDRFDVIIMMDADLSHPPEMIPDFLAAVDDGATFVIGSRYIPGGGTPDWSWHRKMLSKGGNIFARFIAGLHDVHDCTSGYRAIDCSLLRKIEFAALATRGYAFLSTLLYEATVSGARVREIPLVFRDRTLGETKLSMNDMIEFFFNSVRLRLKRGRRRSGRAAELS